MEMKRKMTEEDDIRENEQTDIDQRGEIEEELDYEAKMKKYFERIEAEYGLDVANKTIQKFAGLEQFKYFLDLNEWSFTLAQDEVNMMQDAQAHQELVTKQIDELAKAQMDALNLTKEQQQSFFNQLQELVQTQMKMLKNTEKQQETLFEQAEQAQERFAKIEELQEKLLARMESMLTTAEERDKKLDSDFRVLLDKWAKAKKLDKP